MKLKKIFLILILILAFILRFYKLGEVPAGIHHDEESHGYNAFSILKTGRDRYGEPFPILFRSFGSYQPPLYTYLSIIPVGIFGNTIASVRSVSALSGVILVLITYFFVLESFNTKYRKELALIASLVVAISPWSIYFSRLVAEGNLGVTLFTLSILVFLLSLKRAYLFPVATFVLGLSTHAYYSERVISILFLPIFLFLFRDYFLKKNRIWVLAGLAIFAFLMIPHIWILSTGALTRRLVQVGYFANNSLTGFARILFFVKEFIRRYLLYFSPRNLFFDLGAGLGRTPPDLGVFYTIFIIPFFVGIKNLKKYVLPKFFKLLVMLLLIVPLPAALTADSYYPLRTLDLIWLFSLIISLGIFVILQSQPTKIGFGILVLVLIHSLFSFYISYFIFFKYERAKDYGNAYVSLLSYFDKYEGYKIVIDSARHPGAGLRIAYLTSYDPEDLQTKLREQLKTPYYASDVALYEDYIMGPIEVKTIDWGELECRKILLVGDNASISSQDVKDHNLKYEFEVRDLSGYDGLIVYSTNPHRKCDQD